MGWVYLDDRFPEHPKVLAAGDDAAWMFVCGLAYTNRGQGDGVIPKNAVARLTGHRSPQKLAQLLVDVDLWHDKGDCFAIHDYGFWNAQAMARRAKARKAANARWGNTDPPTPDAQASPEHDGEHSPSSATAMQYPKPQAPSRSRLSQTHARRHPDQAAAPPETETTTRRKAPWRDDPLVARFCDEVTHNHRSTHQARTWDVIRHLRAHVDEAAIDETIGRLAKLDTPVTSPNFLLTTVTNWAAERDIRIPPMGAGK